MQKVQLGNTQIRVSRLGLGLDVLGRPKERGPSPTDYAPILRRALDLGVNFWDTSDDYGTHPHVRSALQGIDRASVVISTKTWVRDAVGARRSLENSLTELGTDYVDIFLIHAVHPGDLDAALRAIGALRQAKADGLVRAVGLSTHFVAVANHVARETDVEVVYVTFNPLGFDIDDGSIETMSQAASRCFAAGKGVCTLKALALGRLANDLVPALEFSLKFPYAHATLVGIKTPEELEVNVAIAEGKEVSQEHLRRLIGR